MPELPEVETIARRLRPSFIGRKLLDTWTNWPRMLSPGPVAMRRALSGRRLIELTRRGKLLVWRFEPEVLLLVHLRMSGHPTECPSGTPPAKHVHFVLRFEGGRELHLDDARKFARVRLADDLAAATADLGIEPLSSEFTVDWLYEAMRRRARRLKPALLDQSLIAGLGNIYTDESLHRAGLHPLRSTASLRRPEAARLHQAIRQALHEGIRRNGASIDWVYPGGEMQDHFLVYGRAGERCGVCGTLIRRLVVGQRGTHVCPRCQRPPRRG
ncbi:MAG: bifunctional DNA-formamidopyrimidine glycosylase/DNA-(apurinic or apyrimidinic site) lyase [Phycisphaerae bacterium]|nr:bifunctional DNA-formamidopyrimidine glycosylase/DNA-(apurinic or apyrimidinic site) lyase [Phycisphaerae bacterium]NUQ47922.1 bifunctional DNA-formamidopyrimidine glycosylase/DNA-(apurinic or apyrimidinic site) lyase [Phycisphaerae bacterium]